MDIIDGYYIRNPDFAEAYDSIIIFYKFSPDISSICMKNLQFSR